MPTFPGCNLFPSQMEDDHGSCTFLLLKKSSVRISLLRGMMPCKYSTYNVKRMNILQYSHDLLNLVAVTSQLYFRIYLLPKAFPIPLPPAAGIFPSCMYLVIFRSLSLEYKLAEERWSFYIFLLPST